MVASCYGILAYVHSRKKSEVSRRYGKQYIQVTTELFCRWVPRKNDATTDNQEQRHQLGVSPAPFCTMRYINHPRHLPGVDASTDTRKLRPRQATVEFGAAVSICTVDCIKLQGLQMITLRNNRVGEEPFENYSMEYLLEYCRITNLYKQHEMEKEKVRVQRSYGKFRRLTWTVSKNWKQQSS